MNPADTLTTLLAMVRDDQADNRETVPSDGPGEHVMAEADGDWLADREENRRWRRLP